MHVVCVSVFLQIKGIKVLYKLAKFHALHTFFQQTEWQRILHTTIWFYFHYTRNVVQMYRIIKQYLKEHFLLYVIDNFV